MYFILKRKTGSDIKELPLSKSSNEIRVFLTWEISRSSHDGRDADADADGQREQKLQRKRNVWWRLGSELCLTLRHTRTFKVRCSSLEWMEWWLHGPVWHTRLPLAMHCGRAARPQKQLRRQWRTGGSAALLRVRRKCSRRKTVEDHEESLIKYPFCCPETD